MADNKTIRTPCVAIRREDRNRWERRAPLAPQHVAELVKKGIKVLVQPSTVRTYSDKKYEEVSTRNNFRIFFFFWLPQMNLRLDPKLQCKGRLITSIIIKFTSSSHHGSGGLQNIFFAMPVPLC